MMRITALNDFSKDEDDFQEENVQVSKEAQETIAASEYLRALSLKQSGKSDFALGLFEDLLRTNVIYDVPSDDKDNKLFSVKYNCYRNIGLIYEEKKQYDLALKFLVDAVNLDDTDVYTQCKVGKIALRLNKFMTAKAAFEKCLDRNPNHCGAKDSYLETLCQMELIEAAYGFAFKCYAEDRKYGRAIRVLKEIRERFKLSLEYYDGIYGYAPDFDEDCKINYDPENSVFPVDRVPNLPVDTYTVVPDDYKIPEEEVSWVTFGKLIHKIYEYTIENKHSLLTFYKWDDWVCKAKVEEPERPAPTEENEANQPKSSDENDENMNENDPQSEGNDEKSPEGENSENPDQESKKSSNRRRCSDLDFLKEWGWHKNRRSTRKKQKEEEETVDTSINGLIRRILPNYFTQTFCTKNSPFIPEVVNDEKSLEGTDILDTSKTDAEDEEKFNELTKDSFAKFIASFKDRDFDLLIPLFEWLRYISLYWNQTIIPAEIIAIYKKIYAIYENCIDYHNMHHMSDDEFTATFRAAIFYFELLFDEYEETKAEIPDDYVRLKDFLQVNIAFIDDDMDCTRMLVRLLRLTYGIHLHYNNYKDALGFLYKIEEIYDVPKYHDIAIDFKNCRHHKSIDFKTVKDLVVKIERKINLASVKKLYDTQNYEELVEILLESITYSTGPKVNIDSLTLKIQTQIEVLLECLFSLNRIEECMSYAEKSLYYAVNNFLTAPTEYRLEEWASLVNFCLVYIEAIIKEDGNDMLLTLNDKLPRLVQSLTQIITSQLDTPLDKNCPKLHLINLTLPWIILFPLVQREDDILNALNSKKKASEENMEVTEEFGVVANAITMLFSAHELMGRKQWCMKDNGKLWLFLLDNLAPILRTPMLDPFRDYINENLEQTTYCLYGFPAKKARLRHIEEHDAKNIELTWERAIQLFDLYRPETLPEFDSFKLASITSEMEQLLQRILALIPKCLDIQPFVGEIRSFINGTTTQLPKEMNILPSKISSIYYLLADFYFKNQETSKAVKFFINDLTMKPDRFDSWASMSLCKQSKLEMRLNSYNSIDVKSYLEMADQAIICFSQCLKLKRTSTILTEFGSFTYHLHSFCSRNLKQASETLSMENFAALEERKEKFLNLSYKCFNDVSQSTFDTTSNKNPEDGDDNHDEKWYYSFMLGKIAEKRKEVPSVYLNHFIKSAKYLYEDNATYPIKINHNNPTHLAIESLEVFYRTTACIMKYIEQHGKINKSTAKLFVRVLKELASSPFAYNRAKINEDNINALKRKINTNGVGEVNQPKQKIPKVEPQSQKEAVPIKESDENLSEMLLNLQNPLNEDEKMEVDLVPKEEIAEPKASETEENQQEAPIQPVIRKIIDNEAGSRRGSQESAVTSTTTTTTTHSSSTSSDSSSDSSDSDSTSSDDETDQENVYVDEEQVKNIYKMCIKNFEECISRFPEHYKSIYRLVYHFLNINESLEKCRQLLLTSDYKTTLGNSVGGLFHERKNNNFFNGIWRIPSQEIDRPGNFTTHLSKCIIILMDVLKKTNDYETLIDLALQLQRNPEADKKYLSDTDKKDLFQQAVACGVQAFKNKLREILNGIADGKNNDRDLLSLMLEIFKANRKTLKTFQQKDQSLFSGVLVEVYKEYIKDKMILPENANYTDLAFKMCQQEINYRKNLEKGIITPNPNPVMPLIHQQPQQPVQSTASPILNIKSVSEINKSIMSNSNPGTPTPQSSTPSAVPHSEKPPITTSMTSTSTSSSSSARTKPRSSSSSTKSSASQLNSMYNSMLMALYSNPAVLTSSYISEYYKMLGMPSPSSSATSPTLNAQQLALLSDPNFASTLLSSMTAGLTSTSPSKSSSSPDLKLLESLMSTAAPMATSSKASHLQGLQQNLLSNSLSITTTTISSTSSTSSRMSLGSATSSATVTKSSSSVRKSTGDLKESKKSKESSASKMAANISKYGLLGSNLNLPDLPKSLSITPTMPIGSSSSSSGMKSTSEKKSKEKSHNLSASSSASLSNLGKYNLNPSLSITPEAYSSASSRSNMLQSYQEFLKAYPGNQSTLPGTKKSTSTHGLSSSSASLLKQQKSKAPSQQPQSQQQQKKSQVPTAKIPYDFGKNIASSFSGHPSLVSPKPTHSSSPFSQHTPPLTPSPSSIVSPPKTLQQKLAERKAQNQQQKTNVNKKPDNDDVIVLD